LIAAARHKLTPAVGEKLSKILIDRTHESDMSFLTRSQSATTP
jgi:hypothetical protein